MEAATDLLAQRRTDVTVHPVGRGVWIRARGTAKRHLIHQVQARAKSKIDAPVHHQKSLQQLLRSKGCKVCYLDALALYEPTSAQETYSGIHTPSI